MSNIHLESEHIGGEGGVAGSGHWLSEARGSRFRALWHWGNSIKSCSGSVNYHLSYRWWPGLGLDSEPGSPEWLVCGICRGSCELERCMDGL